MLIINEFELSVFNSIVLIQNQAERYKSVVIGFFQWIIL